MSLELKKQLLEKNIPIIIGGCGRSGTTLLLSILSAHPEIYSIPFETRIFCPRDKKNNIDLTKNIDTIFLYQYLMYENVLNNDNIRWCEKTPKNIYYFEKINSYFNENVKMIHIIRDGRDVVTSIHPQFPNKYWVTPNRWFNDTREGLKYKTYNNVLTIKYEDLILKYDFIIKEILTFLELRFHSNMNHWLKHSTILKSVSIKNNMIDIHENSIGKWKLDKHKKIIEEFYNNGKAVFLLNQLGYE